jgi:hypothetical protein
MCNDTLKILLLNEPCKGFETKKYLTTYVLVKAENQQVLPLRIKTTNLPLRSYLT